MKTFEEHIKELEQIENFANRYSWKLKKPQNSEKLWYELQPKWEQLYNKIQTEFPEKYEEYRKENNLVKNYNFSDVIA